MNEAVTTTKLKRDTYSDRLLSTKQSVVPVYKKQPIKRIQASVLGALFNKRQPFISALLTGGLCTTLVLYVQTTEVIQREGLKAIAIILLLCQLRNLSQTTKQQ